MSRHRAQVSWKGQRHPVAVWVILGVVFAASAGVNLFLASIDTQVWPFVVGFCLIAVTLWCAFMAWREHNWR